MANRWVKRIPVIGKLIEKREIRLFNERMAKFAEWSQQCARHAAGLPVKGQVDLRKKREMADMMYREMGIERGNSPDSESLWQMAGL